MWNVNTVRSLSLKILFISLAGPGLAFMALGFYQLNEFKTNSAVQFETDLESRVLSLSENLSSPLWNFSESDAESAIKTALSSGPLRKVRILDTKGSVFAEGALASNGPLYKVTKIIKRNDLDIGSIEVWYGKEILNANISGFQIRLVTSSLLALSIAIFSIVLFMRKSILKRIQKLNQQFETLGSGHYQNPFEWSCGDQLNSLGQSLEQTRIKLAAHIEEIDQKNMELQNINHTLECAVEARSQQLLKSSKMAGLGEMAGGVAHEINNPLAIIRGKAELIRLYVSTLAETPPQQTAVKNLDSIEKTIERMSRIIRSLKTISRDGEKDPFVPQNVAALISEVLELCRNRFKNQNIELAVEIPDKTPDIECRPVEISQALLNLINNAYDATENHHTRWVRLNVHHDSEEICFSVTDSGAPIKAAVKEKLMKPFFTTKAPGKGTGLGLSISRSIAVGHAGELILDARKANTCFKLILPIKQHGRTHEAA